MEAITMIIQTSSLPPIQAMQPDMRAHGTAVSRSEAPQPGPQAPASTAEVHAAVAALNQAMQQSGQALEFSVDGDSHRTVVRMVDTNTGELIRQYPSEATLAISRNIAEFQQGLLIEQKA
jgi:flagellar protein FlaG